MYALNSLTNYNLLSGVDTLSSAFNDPRLISAAHSGQRLLLDAPVRDGSVRMADVPKLASSGHTGTNYRSYGDITKGDISYYYDSQLGVPFFSPLFDPSDVVKVDYVDPMGTYKAHYYRKNVTDANLGLTWLSDSQMHRNDLLALSMWNRNQTEPMYVYN